MQRVVLGQHPTPRAIVQRMLDMGEVDAILAGSGRILDAGCGDGVFLLAILERTLRLAKAKGQPLAWVLERQVGIELDALPAGRCRAAARTMLTKAGYAPTADQLGQLVREGDFLTFRERGWHLVVSNPPYVRLEGIEPAYRKFLKQNYQSAVNRFDLYFFFFEQAIRLLRPGGRLCFITPQKFTQVWSASGLRTILSRQTMERILLLDEEAFPGLITYPAITLLQKADPKGHVLTIDDERLGVRHEIPVTALNEAPWKIRAHVSMNHGLVLDDVCERIGVGIATGLDHAFQLSSDDVGRVPSRLRRFMAGGRQLPKRAGDPVATDTQMAWPYDDDGRLLEPREIPQLVKILERHRADLEARTTIKHHPGKPWYAFHERPRPRELAQPKLLVQDISLEPMFHVDDQGTVPKHSIYYLVPKAGVDINELANYLNGQEAQAWLRAHCQPAAGGRLRIQSLVLRTLPVPETLLLKGHRTPTLSAFATSA